MVQGRLGMPRPLLNERCFIVIQLVDTEADAGIIAEANTKEVRKPGEGVVIEDKPWVFIEKWDIEGNDTVIVLSEDRVSFTNISFFVSRLWSELSPGLGEEDELNKTFLSATLEVDAPGIRPFSIPDPNKRAVLAIDALIPEKRLSDMDVENILNNIINRARDDVEGFLMRSVSTTKSGEQGSPTILISFHPEVSLSRKDINQLERIYSEEVTEVVGERVSMSPFMTMTCGAIEEELPK